MNERIADLLEQAFDRCKKYDDEGKTGLVRTTEAFHLFAELIVRECMDTILKESKWYWDKDEFESSNAIQNAARKVKEHFGVE